MSYPIYHSSITTFSGKFRWLSNFYASPVVYKGLAFPTVENAYQAAKTDNETFRRKLTTCSPGLAKRYGASFIQPDGFERVSIMRLLLEQKFKPWSELAIRLEQTGDCLIVEGNDWMDTFWGQCPVGNGLNMLGSLIMEIRRKNRLNNET